MKNKIICPVYLELPFKYKKIQVKNKNGMYNTTLSYNEVLIMNRFAYSKIKKAFAKEVEEQILELDIPIPEEGDRYTVCYDYYYKNARSDLSNFSSTISKFLLDTLQKHGVILEDNISVVVQEVFSVMGQDKENPRMEVTIHKMK